MAKTLLQMAGADLTPPKFSDATLLLIDAQREYVDGALPLPGVRPALDNIARLLQAARAAGAPVVHVQHKGRPGGLFDPGKTAFQLADEAASLPGEAVVEKALPNGFAGTNLKDVLDAADRKRLVIAGFMTHMCVSSTARAALDLGFQTTIAADACATRDLPRPNGGVLSAADLHDAEVVALADRFSIVCNTSDLVRQLYAAGTALSTIGAATTTAAWLAAIVCKARRTPDGIAPPEAWTAKHVLKAMIWMTIDAVFIAVVPA